MALVGALVATTPAWAGVELLTPAPPVSPDGFDVLVVGEGVLKAMPAEARHLGGGAWHVQPRAGGKSVTLEVSGVTRTLSVGPPATTVSLSLLGSLPVKGRDASSTINVMVRGADGAPDPESAPPVIRANVGQVDALERIGPGNYRARYTLPLTRHPEVAIIVAFAAWPHPQSTHGAVGSLRVPLASAVEVPGHTEAQAVMELTIAGKAFGPVTAATDGSFRLPVVVPPGYGTAMGTAVDRLGNRRTVPMDLHIPPTDQLACVVTPPRIPPDGRARARVLCATSDAFGGPARGAKVQLTATAGTISTPRDLGDGIIEWGFISPTARGSGAVSLTARWRQGKIESREDLAVELVQGPVARAEAAVDPESVVHLGGRVRFEVRVTDSLKRPVPGVSLTSSAAGLAVSSDSPGLLKVAWSPPSGTPVGAFRLPLIASGPSGSEPAAVQVFREGGLLFASVTDISGLPVGGQELVLATVGAAASATRTLRTGEGGVVELGVLNDGVHDLRHALWPGLRARLFVRQGGSSIFPESSPPGRVTLAAEFVVAPPAPVVVRVQADGTGVTWWVESPGGEVLDGREVQLTVKEKVSRASSRGRARVEVPGRPANVSVVDVATRVAAAVELP